MGVQEKESGIAAGTLRKRVPTRTERAVVSGSPALNRKVGRRAEVYADGKGLQRLVFFSHAIFAMAITLLALQIRLPQLDGDASNEALLAALGALRPRYLGFGISFPATDLYRLAHHTTFRAVVRYETRLLWLNLMLLTGVASMSFPTSVVRKHAKRVATQFYAPTAGLAALALSAVGLYSHVGAHMLAGPVPGSEIRRGLI